MAAEEQQEPQDFKLALANNVNTPRALRLCSAVT